MAYRPELEYEVETRERREHDHHTIGDLIMRLTYDLRHLLVQEIKLAKTEVSEKVTQVNRGIVSLAVGGLVLYAGFLGLMTAAIFGLALVMDLWAAALIVGLVVAIIGGIMLLVGRNRLHPDNLELKRTKESLREDKEWLKHKMNP